MAATAPAIGSFGSAFIATGGDGYGEPPAGDHLQSVYRFWLVGHQLAHGHAPWRDPYSFQPLVPHETVLGGWPFGFLYWPLGVLFGPVVAWNLLLLGTIVAAGLLTYAWLRALGVGDWAAAIGGLAFAVAPYRLAQSATGHLLGWAAILVPLGLLGIERARTASTPRRANAWGAVTAAALASIAVSGQLHLALGAVPFVLAYALVRRGRVPLLWTAGGAVAAAVVGLVVRYTLIAGSAEDQGRSLAEVRKFQAEWPDLVNRWHRPGSEELVYIGWLTPVLAVAGLVFLWRGRRGLAVVLGLGAVLPILLSLGTNLPIYSPLWHALPPLRFPRVPERFMPIADLAIAALVAFAAAELIRRAGRRGTAAAAALLVLVALDLGDQPVAATAADPDNAAYAALTGPGRILELPLFDPGIHYGSVYDYYELQAERERPQGYNTLAPEAAFDFAFTYDRISCGVWKPGDDADARPPRGHARPPPRRCLRAGRRPLGLVRVARARGARLEPGRPGRPDRALREGLVVGSAGDPRAASQRARLLPGLARGEDHTAPGAVLALRPRPLHAHVLGRPADPRGAFGGGAGRRRRAGRRPGGGPPRLPARTAGTPSFWTLRGRG